MSAARIDKWLWAVRIFKTRSIATDACKKNRVSINGQPAKASKEVKAGDKVTVRKPPIEYKFEVIEAIQKRVGAKLVAEYMRNITDPEQYEILKLNKLSGFIDRAKGLGRPTKKDRRELEQFQGDVSDEVFFFDWEEDFDDDFEDDEFDNEI